MKTKEQQQRNPTLCRFVDASRGHSTQFKMGHQTKFKTYIKINKHFQEIKTKKETL